MPVPPQYCYLYPSIPILCNCGCGTIIWHKGSQFAPGHYNKGKQIHTTEQKQKWAKIRKGRPSPTKGKIGHVAWNKGLLGYHAAEHHYNWQGGISFLPYCEKFNRKLKEAIKERDNHTCQLCGIKQNKRLQVHHIHYKKEDCEPDLIALCVRCNPKVNFNKNYYENLFMNKLNDRELLFWTKRYITNKNKL